MNVVRDSSVNQDKVQGVSRFKMFCWMIIIGGLVGFAGVIYRYMLNYSHIGFFDKGESILSFMGSYYIIFLPVIGGLIVGILNYLFGQNVKGHGVPEVMAAVDEDGKINGKVIWLKSIASAITMGSGGSVGPEGPMVQIGAGIGSNMRFFGSFDRKQVCDLAAAGSAAGIAAIFNAPLAGVIFTLEVIVRKYDFWTFILTVMASGISALTYRLCMGQGAIYTVESLKVNAYYDYLIYILLGIAAGLLSVFWIKLMGKTESFCGKFKKIPPYIKPAIGGLAVGVIGIWLPMVMGEGHDFTAEVLNGNYFFGLLLLACLFKVITNCITLGSGSTGGVFAPAVFIGATLGAGIAGAVNFFFPFFDLSVEAFAVVGIAAVLAGFFHAPLTAVIMAFEITNNYSLVIPLCIAAAVATFTAKSVYKHSLYTFQLEHRNMAKKKAEEQNTGSADAEA